MPPLNAVFVFGSSGNLVAALGRGWSTEDEFAWAVGAESELSLPMSGDGRACTLRFDLHPALFPPALTRQRLIIQAGETELLATEITRRTTLTLSVPERICSGRSSLDLLLRHPDCDRPSNHGVPNDSRLLSLCFHSATLTADDETITEGQQQALEPMHGIVIGQSTARRLCEIAANLPFLSKRVGFRFIDVGTSAETAARALPPGTLDSFSFAWIDQKAGTAQEQSYWQDLLGSDRRTMRLYTPHMHAWWPFAEDDPRARPEPGRYVPARYSFGDRIAKSLLAMNMPDDVIYLMYEMAADGDAVDLNRLLAADETRWRADDERSAIKLAPFLEQHIRTRRLFVTPYMPGPALVHEIARQFVAATCRTIGIDAADLPQQLDALLEGYVGWQEELPVCRRVASHFNLPWWSASLKYQWWNNDRTYREYILDYIRWAQWRP